MDGIPGEKCLCDRKLSARLKGKVYKAAVRPAMMYGSETWAMNKVHEKKVDVAQMRMLRWMCGVTRKDKIQNELIRGTVKVAQISSKMQERRLNWYGYVMRTDENYVGRRGMTMDVEGRRGTPKLRWKDKLREDMTEKGLLQNQVAEKNIWKRLVRNSDPI